MDINVISGCDLFKDVGKESIENLLTDSPNRMTEYKKGEIIALQGSPCRSIYILCEGKVTAKMAGSEGKELSIDHIEAPEVLAPAFVFSSENKFPVTVEAEEKTTVCIINKDSYLRFMQQNPMALQNFLRIISDRCLFLSKKLNEFALQSLKDRVINLLKRVGKIESVQDAATMLGVARPSLSRIIGEMIEEGSLVKEGHVIKINK
ncbi:MAG: Crp/Fnr family transcriptional regulator [Bacteroides sp.]|nr:Crp/Fnr family transcriptional regulator [Bacteroides sp.]